VTRDEALRKVTLLMKLAERGGTPEEAANAAAKAQIIMERFNIELAMLEDEQTTKEPDEPVRDWNDEAAIEGCRRDKAWIIRLGSVVAHANGCEDYYVEKLTGTVGIKLVGRASDVQAARYLMGLLKREVQRLSREHAGGYGEKYQRDFKYGVVDAIARKFKEQRNALREEMRHEAGNGMALVRVNNAIQKLDKREADAAAFLKSMNLKASQSRISVDPSARERGFAAGQSIQLNSARGGLTSGAKQLK
jgi:hypothetical protein